jgi:hypothetical protein
MTELGIEALLANPNHPAWPVLRNAYREMEANDASVDALCRALAGLMRQADRIGLDRARLAQAPVQGAQALERAYS